MNNVAIDWWSTFLGDKEAEAAYEAIKDCKITQGVITEKLEHRIAESVGAQYCVVVPSGSMGLLLSMIAIGISPGDEVIVPVSTWIATPHAAALLGAKIVFVDCMENQPIVNIDAICNAVTNKTRAIIPVHLAGRAVDMKALVEFSHKHGIVVVEDAAQAFSSRDKNGFLGVQSDIGVFSFGLAKLVSIGQGGAVVTNNRTLYDKLRCAAIHGVENTPEEHYRMFGMNMKFPDILAAVGLEQLNRLKEKQDHVIQIYRNYKNGLRDISSIAIMPCNLDAGEIPLWTEIRCKQRDLLRSYLSNKGIETRIPHKPLFNADHLSNPSSQKYKSFPNADTLYREMLVLPSGPSQQKKNVTHVINTIKSFRFK